MRFRGDLVPELRSLQLVKGTDEDDDLRWDSTEAAGARQEGSKLGSLLGVALAIALLALAFWSHLVNAEVGAAAGAAPAATRAKAEQERAARALIEDTEEVKAVAKAFLAAPTPAERLQWVVHSEGVEERMGIYYERHPPVSLDVYDFSVIGVTPRFEGTFFTAEALTTDGSRIALSLPVTPDGPRIAWEAHVAYGDYDWGEFLDRRPSGQAEMRVYIAPCDYYVSPYDREEEFLSVKIIGPRSDRALFGFISKSGTENVAAMRPLLVNERPSPVLLTLRFPAEGARAKTPYVVVDQFLGASWFDLRQSTHDDGMRDLPAGARGFALQ